MTEKLYVVCYRSYSNGELIHEKQCFVKGPFQKYDEAFDFATGTCNNLLSVYETFCECGVEKEGDSLILYREDSNGKEKVFVYTVVELIHEYKGTGSDKSLFDSSVTLKKKKRNCVALLSDIDLPEEDI